MNAGTKSIGLNGRVILGSIVFLIMLVLGVAMSQAGEIVPSVGLTKATNGGADAQGYTGLAFRGSLTPLFMTELGIAYRSESRFNDQLHVRQWPVTASLYARPVSALYLGGGVGWYHTTYDYSSTVPISDETRQQFGVHLGGGLQVPLGSSLGIDLNGRYVMMRDQESHLIPENFNPDFWTTSLGLAFKF